MTVSSATSKTIGAGNGATTNWPFVWKVLSASDLEVTYTDASGVETLLTTADYAVSLNPNQNTSPGGSIVYPLAGSAIVTGTKLTVRRVLQLTQLTDLKNQGGYYPEVVEIALDRRTMVEQQINELLGRALVAPVSDTAPTALPTAAVRASKALGFDSSGNPIAVSPGSAVTSADAVTFLQSGAHAESRTAQDKMRDIKSAKDGGVVGNGTANDTTKLLNFITDHAGYGNPEITVPAGVYLFTSLSLPAFTKLRGAGRDKTIFKPHPLASNSGWLVSALLPGIEILDITIDTTGWSAKGAIDIGVLCNHFTMERGSLVGNLSGAPATSGAYNFAPSLVRNQGDQTSFIDVYAYHTHASGVIYHLTKDAQSTPGVGDPKGNNHLIIGGKVEGGPPNGILIDQYNLGALTTDQRKARRVEGVTVDDWRYICAGGYAIKVMNSLGVRISGSTLDQIGTNGVWVLDGAEAVSITNNWMGSVAPRTNKIGVLVEVGVGRDISVDGNQMWNLDVGVKATASVSAQIGKLQIKDNVFNFIDKSPIIVDSIGRCTIEGNIDESAGHDSGSAQGSIQILATYTGASRRYTISGNTFPDASGAYDTGAEYCGKGNSGAFQWLDHHACSVGRSSTQNISTGGGGTAVSWNSEDFDPRAMHDNSTNPSRLTVPPGVTCVELTAVTDWDNNSAGERTLWILKNGTTTIVQKMQAALRESRNDICTGPIAVSPTDYFELMVFQDSGGTRTIGGFSKFMMRVLS